MTVIDNTAQVAVQGTTEGRQWVNVFHVEKPNTTPLTESEANNIADVFEGRWNVTLRSNLHNTWFMQTIRVTDLDTANGPSFIFSTSLQGGNAGESLSPDTSGIITWRTALRGQRYRGRTYLSGMTEGLNDSTGRPTSGWQGIMQTFADNLLADLVLNGTILRIGHKDLGTATDVTGGDARPVWRRQRRRNYRV